MRLCACFFTCVLTFGALAHAAELPVRQETLGAWHYVVPPNLAGPDAPQPVYMGYLNVPTVVSFAQGKRIAFILPGTNRVAEFRDGVLTDLNWSPLELPITFAADSDGTLACLVRLRKSARDDQVPLTQFVVFLPSGAKNWGKPLRVPLPADDRSYCDHLEYDSRHRLWFTGPCGKVAVLTRGGWDTYAYSNDMRMDFAPIRLSETADGDVVLFADWDSRDNSSHMTGTLVYHAGKFVRDPNADEYGANAAQQKKEDKARADDSIFSRATGYVCGKTGALNDGPNGPVGVLVADGYSLVTIGNTGFAWARNDDLKNQPALSEDAEWQTIDDVLVAPATAPNGEIWLVRDNPPRLIHIGARKTDEYPNSFPDHWRVGYSLFDQRGRLWLVGDSALPEAGVYIFDNGLHDEGMFEDALRAHAADFKRGKIFTDPRENDRHGSSPGVLKLTSGPICLGGPGFENFTILDGGQTLTFAPNEIKPDQQEPDSGHGYNPFNNGDPREEANGDVTTCVDGVVYRYYDKQWLKVGNFVYTNSGPAPDFVPRDPMATQFKSVDGRTFIFRGFHFYEKTDGGLVQIDSGLNPLAHYPFWRGWYSSPGMTQPRLDPTGHIWISSLGPYSINSPQHREDAVWQVLRQPVPVVKKR